MTRFLLTNDDGIEAPGLVALEHALQLATSQRDQVIVSAPDRGYSGCGHTTTTGGALRVELLSDHRFKVYGTPADCARVALCEFARDTQVVLSGINAGANAGVDLWMSGTVAAVREAGWLGVPGVAISQYIHGNCQRDWQKTAKMAARALNEVLTKPLGNAFWNVNLPDVDVPFDEIDIHHTFLEPAHIPVSYRKDDDGAYWFSGDYHGRHRTPGSDVDICLGGAISISEIPWPRISKLQ